MNLWSYRSNPCDLEMRSYAHCVVVLRLGVWCCTTSTTSSSRPASCKVLHSPPTSCFGASRPWSSLKVLGYFGMSRCCWSRSRSKFSCFFGTIRYSNLRWKMLESQGSGCARGRGTSILKASLGEFRLSLYLSLFVHHALSRAVTDFLRRRRFSVKISIHSQA